MLELVELWCFFLNLSWYFFVGRQVLGRKMHFLYTSHLKSKKRLDLFSSSRSISVPELWLKHQLLKRCKHSMLIQLDNPLRLLQAGKITHWKGTCLMFWYILGSFPSKHEVEVSIWVQRTHRHHQNNHSPPKRKKTGSFPTTKKASISTCFNTVDGRNPAPVDG